VATALPPLQRASRSRSLCDSSAQPARAPAGELRRAARGALAHSPLRANARRVGRARDERGQGTTEYVGLVALVAVVLALAAGLTAGGVGGQLLAGLQRGLCRVAGGACRPQQPSDRDLAPCPVERLTRGESLDGALELISLGRSGMLTAVRDSSGRVRVTLVDGKSAGLETGLGGAVSVGSRRVSAKATADLAARIVSSRSWTLPSAAAARAFIDRYGAKATIGGKAIDLVRSGCSILCDAIGWRPHAQLPPPDDVALAHGAAARLEAELGVATSQASTEGLLGARLARDGTRTWYLQLDASLGARLARGAAVRAGAGGRGQALVSYALDADGRPTQLVVHTVARWSAGGALGAELEPGSAAAVLTRANGRIGAEAGRATELDATLDLRDSRNRRVAAAFIAALRDPLALGELPARAAALRARIVRAGVVDRRTYAISSDAFALGAKLALGEQLGADFERRHEGARLLRAETRLPGLPFLPRDDCRAG
jgi:hypothetical protein